MKQSIVALTLAIALPLHAFAATITAPENIQLSSGVPLSTDELAEVTAGSFDLLNSLVDKANKGPFDYTFVDHDPDGGSLRFVGIDITGSLGLVTTTIDAATAKDALTTAGFTAPPSFYSGGDVMQMAVPATSANDDASRLLNISIAAIKMGNSSASFGSFALNQVSLRGTTIWIWPH